MLCAVLLCGDDNDNCATLINRNSFNICLSKNKKRGPATAKVCVVRRGGRLIDSRVRRSKSEGLVHNGIVMRPGRALIVKAHMLDQLDAPIHERGTHVPGRHNVIIFFTT